MWNNRYIILFTNTPLSPTYSIVYSRVLHYVLQCVLHGYCIAPGCLRRGRNIVTYHTHKYFSMTNTSQQCLLVCHTVYPMYPMYPPNEPSLHTLPNVPTVVPSAPTLARLSVYPAVALHRVPSLQLYPIYPPTVSNVPSLHTLPNMPTIPSISTVVPNVPTLPNLLSVPKLSVYLIHSVYPGLHTVCVGVIIGLPLKYGVVIVMVILMDTDCFIISENIAAQSQLFTN